MTESVGRGGLADAGVDAVALKPAECALSRAGDLPVEGVVVDYEGREHVPDADALAALARDRTVRVTTPVRADGFDPLGDDSLARALPAGVRRVLVAGHGAYLTPSESARAVAPRLGAAAERATDPWVGTEGVERLALATGATQFELLSPETERAVRALRAAGFEDAVALYAPLVLTDDPDAVLDAVGGYAARRGPVAASLPDDSPTDASASGAARETLLAACRDYALTGRPAAVRERVDALRDAGVDRVAAYPARGLEAVR
jgi:hypothetical protein